VVTPTTRLVWVALWSRFSTTRVIWRPPLFRTELETGVNPAEVYRATADLRTSPAEPAALTRTVHRPEEPVEPLMLPAGIGTSGGQSAGSLPAVVELFPGLLPERPPPPWRPEVAAGPAGWPAGLEVAGAEVAGKPPAATGPDFVGEHPVVSAAAARTAANAVRRYLLPSIVSS
jgi:hypothetical protein